MKNTKSQNIRLGLFITLGLLLLVVAIYFLGRDRQFFGHSVQISAVFKDVKGLKVGNNVQFSGITIGSVSSMKIKNDSAIQVQMSIDKRAIKFLKENSKAQIGTEGLMGSKEVIIHPGSSNMPGLQEGDVLMTIKPIELNDILMEVSNTSQNASRLTNNLAEIAEKINRGEGIFGSLLRDTVFSENLNQASDNASYISNNLIDITDQIKSGNGDLGRLIYDDSLSLEVMKTTNNINQLAKHLDSLTLSLTAVTNKINHGDGTVNKLLTDSVFADSLDVTLQKINTGVVEVTQTAESLKNSWILNLFSGKRKDKKKSAKSD